MNLKKDTEDSTNNSGIDTKVIRGITIRAILEFIIVSIVLCGIGYFAHCHITNMLNDSLENNISRHIGTISHSIEHEFEQEIHEMHIGASMVERGQVTVEDLISVSNAFERGSDDTGIVSKDGTPAPGSFNTIPEHELSELHAVFDGEDAIIYHKGQGLVFAVPMIINGE